jgi:hypothetical protein
VRLKVTTEVVREIAEVDRHASVCVPGCIHREVTGRPALQIGAAGGRPYVSVGSRSMTGTVTNFTDERAPCGRRVDGERSVQEDQEGLIIDGVYYACGCQQVRAVFHDGSVEMTVTRHDGRLLTYEHSAAHEG